MRISGGRAPEGFMLSPATAGSLVVTQTLAQSRGDNHQSNHFQNPDQRGNHHHSDGARLWRGVAGDLDAVSSLSSAETFWYHDLAAGNDSASSRPPGAVNRQRGW